MMKIKIEDLLMNRKALQFIAFGAFIVLLAGGIHSNIATATNYKYNKIPVKSPVVTSGMKSGVAKYNSGNYVGAIQDFQEYLGKLPKKQESSVTAAYTLYYIALCYTRLGFKDEANQLYQLISDANVNYALTHYSKIAMNCIDNEGNNEICTPKVYKAPTVEEVSKTNAELNQGKDDITKFIESGKAIHPSAMDRITKERMERKLQQEEYFQKQNK